jgi:hypothetical protein
MSDARTKIAEHQGPLPASSKPDIHLGRPSENEWLSYISEQMKFPASHTMAQRCPQIVPRKAETTVDRKWKCPVLIRNPTKDEEGLTGKGIATPLALKEKQTNTAILCNPIQEDILYIRPDLY